MFLKNKYKEFAHYDQALPIGLGQTISQPSLLLEMTIELDLSKDHKVLEIGTGSGYKTVFLAEFAAQKRLKELGYKNISFKVGDGSEGLELSPS